MAASKFTAKKVTIVDQYGNSAKDEAGKEIDFSYKNFALTLLRSPAQEVDTVKLVEMTRLIRKFDKVKTGEEISLTHDDWSLLKELKRSFKTRIIDVDFSDFCEYIEKA